MDTAVLIVGAGPTGLMLANQLARRGVRAMIIDRHSGPAQQTRAMAVQARTLEIYARMGLVERAIALGARAEAANMWTNGRWGARLPLGDIGKSMSPFPFVLMLGQDDNEKIMGEKLRADFGIAVQWNTELTALEQRPRVAAHIRKRGRITARDYVWEKVIDQLLLRVEFAAEKQAVPLPAATPRKRVRRTRTLRSLT